MSSGGETHDHSVSIASVRGEGLIAIGINTKIFIVIHDGVKEQTGVVDDGQVVRGVAFLQSSTGSRYLVSGGDGKRINMYSIPTLKGISEEQSNLFSAGIPLSFSVGPHTKRITHVATCGDSTILFADKFGEVYRLSLTWTPDQTPNSGVTTTMIKCGSAPVFLLQHFSVISTFFLSSPISGKSLMDHSTENGNEKTRTMLPLIGRRLFTCDKDRHARVSCYPDTFRIEQFLWNETPQSVVTSITEIPDPTGLGKNSYFVVGCFNGMIHLWVADNTLLDASTSEPFTLLTTLSPEDVGVVNSTIPTTADDGATTRAVVSLVHVDMSSSINTEIHTNGKSNTQGIFIAYAGIKDVIFVPLKYDISTQKLSFSMETIKQTHLESFPLAMIGLNNDSAFLLGRDGCPRILRLIHKETESTIQLVKECYAELEKEIVNYTQGAADGTLLLRDMNLFALWNYDAVDPRTRKRNARAVSEDDDDNEDGNGSVEGVDTSAAANNTANTTTNGDTVEKKNMEQMVGSKVPRTESGGVV
ncbi:uncharacterized protein TM35_000083030 [Trypanosoma theileri]|uniref:Uncharacterized protein n=1 Tax=Trypanosoma theileri TaxID=67003 RepID=A0A1X0P0S8_9TRYP|nr:uncharacterized protein TM35_000083030 [Trypanosoma theileri]ORC90505.1 hypothetical protein TM35_000083030 [Trypanosoma theileri]